MSMSVLMMFNEGLNNFIGEVGQKPEKVIMPTKWFKEFQADIKEELSIFGNEIVIQFSFKMSTFVKQNQQKNKKIFGIQFFICGIFQIQNI